MDTEYRPSTNGASTAPAPEQRVSFGARDDDTMPASWASRGLTWLHENQPQVFGQMMLAITGVGRKRSQS